MMRCYINPRLPYLYLYLYSHVYLGMSEFCDSAHAEFAQNWPMCAELAVVHRINKAAKKL